MASRAGKRRKVSLNEDEMSARAPSPTLPPVAMTTRKRHTRRHNENYLAEEQSAGKFVKFPPVTPTVGVTHNETELSSTTRTQRKKNTLKEKNIDSNEDKIKEELKIENIKVKGGRNTRSKKNVSIDNVDVNASSQLMLKMKADQDTDVSPKVHKKLKRNKVKSIEINEHDGNSNNLIPQDNDPTGKLPGDDKIIKKFNKNKGKGKKIIEIEILEPVGSGAKKTAGSFSKKYSIQKLETSLTSVNTTAESFHSATGSPPHPSTKLLDTTFDKKSTVTVNEGVMQEEDTTINKTSTPNYDKKICVSDKKKSKLDSNLSDVITAVDSLILQKSLTDNNVSAKPSPSLNEQTLNTTYEKSPERRSSRISKENAKGMISEDIFDASIVLVDSSVDTTRSSIGSSKLSSSIKESLRQKCTAVDAQIPVANEIKHLNANDISVKTPPKIIREGTFTKDSPKVVKETVSPTEAIPSSNGSTDLVVTPIKTKLSLPAPGSTPYHARRGKTRSIEKSTSVLNLTHSIEKDLNGLERRSSAATARQTRVMFCSPVWNSVRDTERKSKIIKSSIKGSNKSFVFEELSPAPHSSSRKRSYTHGDADLVQSKRKKLTSEAVAGSDRRLPRFNLSGSAAKPVHSSTGPATPANAKPLTPRKSKSDTKPTSVRSKLPNFAALHRKQFDKMESLSECQERKAMRARQMLQLPTSGLYTLDGRKSPRVTTAPVIKPIPVKVLDTKKEPTVNPNKTHTRFGFKLTTDVNPFSISSTKPSVTSVKPSKASLREKVNTTISHFPRSNGTLALAKVNATIPSLRREKSKQIISREKSSTEVAEKRKRENRDIIKGVRTNRRFELQMKSRNVKA